MQDTVLIIIGSVWFVAHVAWAFYAVRYCSTGDQLLEALGVIVPGLGGLCLLLAGVLTSPIWSLICLVIALPLMIVGRACYELIVF